MTGVLKPTAGERHLVAEVRHRAGGRPLGELQVAQIGPRDAVGAERAYRGDPVVVDDGSQAADPEHQHDRREQEPPEICDVDPGEDERDDEDADGAQVGDAGQADHQRRG